LAVVLAANYTTCYWWYMYLHS